MINIRIQRVSQLFVVIFSLLYMQTQVFSAVQGLEVGDELFEQSKFSESIVIYEEIIKENPSHYEALWRLSRSYSKQGNLEKKKSVKKEYFSKAVDYAQEAIEVNDNGFNGYLYLAESLGKLSRVEKSEAKVRLSKKIKEAAERAIELDPSHFKAYMILGIWHRKVEDASWMEQQLAKAFFGGLPEASLSEAERNLKKSAELKADFIESHYELALVYKALKKKEFAREELKKAISCPVSSKKEEEIKKKATSLLNKLK